MPQRRLIRWALWLIVMGALIFAPIGGAGRDAGPAPGERIWATQQGKTAPASPRAAPLPASARAASRRLYRRLLGLRRARAGQAASHRQRGAATESPVAAAAPRAAPAFHASPTNFVKAFKENTLADDVGRAAQIASPSAANEGKHVMMGGNNYRSRSVDGGMTWSNIAIPAGPAAAPLFCCDIDTVYDPARGVTFQSLLYLGDNDPDPDPDNGVVQIFVHRRMNLAHNCFYTIDPDGATNNVIPDFPHLGLSNKSLYLATSEFTDGGGQMARMRRFNVDQMADCVSATTNTFSLPSATMGTRVFRPAQAATDTMYWGALIGSGSSSSLRVFKWPETSAAATSQDIALGEVSLFGDTDCRGGTNNTDSWDASASTATGFGLVGAVGGNTIQFLWPVKGGISHPQGHVHGVKLQAEPTIVKVGDVVIQNPNFCIGFPAVASNERAGFGLSLAAGGKAGGGGPAISAWAGLDDDLDGGTPDFVTVKSGTHNPAAGSYGHYLTVHQFEPCDQFFSATNYVFSGGGAATNVDALYVTFGRGREKPCFDGWKDEDRIP